MLNNDDAIYNDMYTSAVLSGKIQNLQNVKPEDLSVKSLGTSNSHSSEYTLLFTDIEMDL